MHSAAYSLRSNLHNLRRFISTQSMKESKVYHFSQALRKLENKGIYFHQLDEMLRIGPDVRLIQIQRSCRPPPFPFGDTNRYIPKGCIRIGKEWKVRPISFSPVRPKLAKPFVYCFSRPFVRWQQSEAVAKTARSFDCSIVEAFNKRILS